MKKFPTIGTSAASTAFCATRIEGPQGTFLYVDGSGKITRENGTLDEPRPNAFSLLSQGVENKAGRGGIHCPGATESCMASCLASTHRVLTADLRYVALSDIRVGDKLLAFDEDKAGDNRRRRFRTGVVRRIRYEVRDVLRVTLESGKQFIATHDHQWLLRAQLGGNHVWRRTDELTKLQSFAVPRYFDEWVPAESFEAGWLAGMYDGEGCLHVSNDSCWSLTLSQKEGPVLERARRAVETVLGETSYTNQAKSRDVAQLRISGGRYQVAKALGILRPTRLLAKFSPDRLGELGAGTHEKIVGVEAAGQAEVALVDVDCGTMIVEGYPHHNCYVDGLAKHASDTYALYEHNSAEIRKILANDQLACDWAMLLADWLEKNVTSFRWHVSGDVFSLEYAQWIADVCAESPNVEHWIYTRSFEFLRPLVAVSTERGGNLALNLSADKDNVVAATSASAVYGGVLRLCYLTREGEVPDYLLEGDVIFPDYALRGGTEAGRAWFEALPAHQKKMVCPVDYMGKSEERRCGRCDRCLT